MLIHYFSYFFYFWRGQGIIAWKSVNWSTHLIIKDTIINLSFLNSPLHLLPPQGLENHDATRPFTSWTIPSVDATLPLNNFSFLCSHINHSTTSMHPPSFHLCPPLYTETQKDISKVASTKGIDYLVHIVQAKGHSKKKSMHLHLLLAYCAFCRGFRRVSLAEYACH